MGGCERESRTTYRDVFRSCGFRRTVADPFTPSGNHRLTFANIKGSAVGFDAEHATENDSVFIKVGSLARLDPTAGTAHVSHADAIGRGVYVTDVFIDQFGLGSHGLNAGRFGNEFGHRVFEFGTV